MRWRTVLPALLAWTVLPYASLSAYPLDGYATTGIARLEAYRLGQRGEVRARILPQGALLSGDEVQLQLAGRPDFALPAPDEAFSRSLSQLLGADASRYGVAILDLTDLDAPRYAEHNAGMSLNPGSVGKIVVALGFFQALADLHPDDLEARRRLLRETRITADAFIRTDHHVVPLWKPGDSVVQKRPIQEGDTENLYTFLDWMASASSNAAASTLQKHLLLLHHFGPEYPPSPEAEHTYLTKTPRRELQHDFAAAIQAPLTRNGLDLTALRQGSFFTREGKRRVPGTSSHATSRELLRFLLLLEQGKLVDSFSSLELKRLLYLTDRRIRYASAPALYDSAVYYKSGSLYSCKPESGFVCEKYHGNVRNFMNSVAIIETPDPDRPLFYLAVITSNVLRKNSAVAHQTLATRVHRMIESFHPRPVAENLPVAESPEEPGDLGGDETLLPSAAQEPAPKRRLRPMGPGRRR